MSSCHTDSAIVIISIFFILYDKKQKIREVADPINPLLNLTYGIILFNTRFILDVSKNRCVFLKNTAKFKWDKRGIKMS